MNNADKTKEFDFMGSTWGKWDLQVQTILDDGYVSLSEYKDDLKETEPEKWRQFVSAVSTEDDAILFDSRNYFFNGDGSDIARSRNYARTLFAYLDIFSPELRCIAITDHNHIHSALMNELVRESRSHTCKVIPGVEINVDGIHILALFSKPPCKQDNFSDGIKSFLGTLGVHSIKTDDRLTIVNGHTVIETVEQIYKEGGIPIFAHCNSDNGLFQERTRTDRTVLASNFNHKKLVVLQSRSKEKMTKTANYIKNNEYFTSTFVETIASDARSLRDIGSPDKDGNYFFCKGLPNFEGFRQACFETETRTFIGSDFPTNPVHRIDKVSINLPNNVRLGDDLFCLSGKFEFPLSPNFTCFIGGRGTGKSTILNLIDEKLKPHKNNFFSDKQLTFEKKKLKIDEHINFDSGSKSQVIDFLSQNEIEKFATDSTELTVALYSRLEKREGGKLEKARTVLGDALDEFDTHLSNVSDDNDVQFDVEVQKDRKDSLLKIIKSFQSEEYQKYSSEISDVSQEHSVFKSSQEFFLELKESVSSLLEQYEIDDTEGDYLKNEYDLATEEVLILLQKAYKKASSLDEIPLNNKLNDLAKLVVEKQAQLNKYLKKRGVTDENQTDVSNASQEISSIDEEIKSLSKRHSTLNKAISSYDIKTLETAKKNYEKTIRETIKTVNSGLTDLDDEVRPIKLEYTFDKEKCLENVYAEFKELFQINPKKYGTLDNHLFEVFQKGDPLERPEKDEFLDKIHDGSKKRELSNAQNAIITTLEDSLHYRLFEKIIDRNLNNPIDFKLINVYYDGKILSRTSFGQRCTAALVLLILLGNNPIIIDEPEGHLDSLLIANYLVDLIKKSKSSRQIIFATHNANLVVNGDADLIYHLSMDEKGLTQATPTVLEDLDNRVKLISLEGGADAFKRRENKYSV